jgi:hypothetical protein
MLDFEKEVKRCLDDFGTKMCTCCKTDCEHVAKRISSSYISRHDSSTMSWLWIRW